MDHYSKKPKKTPHKYRKIKKMWIILCIIYLPVPVNDLIVTYHQIEEVGVNQVVDSFSVISASDGN